MNPSAAFAIVANPDGNKVSGMMILRSNEGMRQLFSFVDPLFAKTSDS